MTIPNLFDFSRFYFLSDAQLGDALWFQPVISTLDSANAYAIGRGDMLPVEPVRLKATHGKVPYPILCTGMVPLLLVSNDTVSAFVNAGLSGWMSYAVSLVDQLDRPVSGYVGLAITGQAGERDYTLSDLVDKPPRSKKGRPYRAIRGLFFQPSNWKGQDFFLIDGLRIVSESVAQVLRDREIASVQLTPLPDVEFSEITVSIDNPDAIEYLEQKRLSTAIL